MKMNKGVFLAGTLLGALGVMLGAFGAHALHPILEEHGRIETYELAVRYQFYHALALLIMGVVQPSDGKHLTLAARLLGAGTIVFSGSLYTLAITGATWWGAVTPVGGVLLLAGWIVLFWMVYKSNQG